jgi:hypothetical protein
MNQFGEGKHSLQAFTKKDINLLNFDFQESFGEHKSDAGGPFFQL